MEQMKIRSESLATRCEICHQTDLFNQETGYCSRCSIMVLQDQSLLKSRPRLKEANGVIVDRRPEMLTLVQSWRTPRTMLNAVVSSSAVFLFLLISIIAIFKVICFSIFIILMLLIFSYAWLQAMAEVFNETTIKVTNKEISIKHGPIPMRSNYLMPTAIFAQLFTKETKTYVKGNFIYSYEVMAKLTDGQAFELTSVPTKEGALFIEQQIESYLGIVDLPVQGEVPREE